jgi:hypothetical protein
MRRRGGPRFGVARIRVPSLPAWATARGAGEGYFNRRNTFISPSWSEWDAGVTFETGPARWSLSGRNLSNKRHVTAEREVGDSQF